MTSSGTLLADLVRENPFQPATSWWRAIELAMVIDHGLPGGTGLDLGCGDGKLMRILLDAAGRRASLVGVDIDPLETRDALAADGSFDFVFSNSVLEHIEELEPVIAEMARMLRPGGAFVFTVPSDGFHDCLAGPLLPWIAHGRYLETVDRRCWHRRYWGEAQWRACLARHGLEVTYAVRYLTAPQTQRWETLSRFTGGLLYTLAGGRVQPIEIQRVMRLRRRGLRLPAWAARALAGAIAAGVDGGDARRSACLLIEARKRP